MTTEPKDLPPLPKPMRNYPSKGQPIWDEESVRQAQREAVEADRAQRVAPAEPVVKVFTYKAQPDNVGAWRMGAACCKAAAAPSGDYVDSGLLLLRELQERGYGVVPLAVPSFGATQDSPTKAEKVWGSKPSPVVAPPPGWKLVPVEPTEEMVEVFLGRLRIVEFLARYRDMLAAAPEFKGVKT